MCWQRVDHPRFDFQNNREDLYIDQSMLDISHTLIMHTIYSYKLHIVWETWLQARFGFANHLALMLWLIRSLREVGAELKVCIDNSLTLYKVHFWHICILKLLATMRHCYAGTTITILNQCTEKLTACRTDQVDTSVKCYVLGASGGTQSIDVGTTWTGGLFWAFPAIHGTDSATGLKAKPQANLAEFTIVAGGQDSYDISNVVSTIGSSTYISCSLASLICLGFLKVKRASLIHASLQRYCLFLSRSVLSIWQSREREVVCIVQLFRLICFAFHFGWIESSMKFLEYSVNLNLMQDLLHTCRNIGGSYIW